MKHILLSFTMLCQCAVLAHAGPAPAKNIAFKAGDMVSIKSAQPMIWLGNARITAITDKDVTVETRTEEYTFALATVSIRSPLLAPQAAPLLTYGPVGYAPQLYQGAPYEAYAGATGVLPAPVGPEYEAPYAEAGAPYYGNNWLPGYGYFPSPYFWWGRASHGREFIPGRDGAQPPLGRPVMANPGRPVMADTGHSIISSGHRPK